MSRISRRLLAVVGMNVAAMLVLAGIASSASASTTATCALHGKASTTKNVQVVGGSGTYSFSSGSGSPLNFACLGVNSAGKADIETFDVTSNGSYTNTVCGTGSASSTDANGGTIGNQTSFGPNDLRKALWRDGAIGGTQVNLSYRVDFTALQGLLTWTGTDGSQPKADVPSVIEITGDGDATDPAPPVGCTNHFEVQGVVEGTVPYNG